MNWLLIASPLIGIAIVTIGLISLRYLLPLDRTAPSRSDQISESVGETARMFGQLIGAAIRDERRKGAESAFESNTDNELEDVLSENRAHFKS